MSDPNRIIDCKKLVQEGIPQEFPGSDSSTTVNNRPEPIVSLGLVQLWAQYVGSGSSKTIQPNMPAIKRFFEELAESGTSGGAEEYEDVKYKFITVNTSGTTTPISSL